MIAVTNPIYPRKEREPCPDIAKVKKARPVNPYEKILAREVKNWFDHSKMTAVVHINPINGEDFFKARVAFHKEGMQLKKYGTEILKLALTDSKYEALLPISKTTQFSTGFVFSPEHNKVSSILKIIKKIPQIQLLCGIVEDRLLSRNELVDYSKMPSIDIVRSQFVNVLNMASGQLVQNLSSHQVNLVNILEAHVRANETPQAQNEVKPEQPEENAEDKKDG